MTISGNDCEESGFINHINSTRMKNAPLFVNLFVGLIFLSCNQKEVVIQDSPIKIGIEFNSSNNVNYSEIFQSIEYVKLETTENCILPSIDQIEIGKDLLFLLCNSNNTIYIYTHFGKFVSKINNIGKGPNEMLGPTDFSICTDNNEIFWLDNTLCKMFVYDFDGNFLRAFNSLNRNCFTLFGTGQYLFYNHLSKFNYQHLESKSSTNLVAITGDCQLLKEYDNYEFPSFAGYSTGRALYKAYDGTIYFLPNYGRTIHSFDQDLNLVPQFKIVFEKDIKTDDIDKMTNEFEFSDYIGSNNFPSITDRLFISRNHLYLIFVYNEQAFHLFYNIDTKDITNVTFGNFKNDMDSIEVNAIYGANKVGLIGLIPMYEFISNYESNIKAGVQSKKADIEEIINSSTEQDNPVLVFLKYKK